MAKLAEKSEFAADVPRIDIDTPVKGFDGTEPGPANGQAQALANRTQYLKQRIDNMSATQVRSVNGKSGTVTITASDTGADPAGTADGLFTGHANDTDPHPQYFDQVRGDARYVSALQANLPDGWLQLDASGKIPAAMLQILAARYIVVADETARLALQMSDNLAIVTQTDIDTLFYLNGGDDPAVDANWIRGQAATVSGVSSVFGRTGAVMAQPGDYDADQVNETSTRKFVTPAEKAAWNAKQALLVSGTNIRSLFGQSLLGFGDLTLTPAQTGAAEAQHTHTTVDISDFTPQTQKLIADSLEAGAGVTLGQNPVSGKTIISMSGNASGGNGGYTVFSRDGATANQNHVFSFAARADYSGHAYALREEAGATNQEYTLETFAAGNDLNYHVTSAVIYDGVARIYTGGEYTLSAEGEQFTQALMADGRKLSVSSVVKQLIPVMTSNSSPPGYTADASSNQGSSYYPYLAFDGKLLSQNGGDCWASRSRPTSSAPQWISIALPQVTGAKNYSIVNRNYQYGNSPASWTFQGSHDGATWHDLHVISADINNTLGAVRVYELPETAYFSHYRLLITDTFNTASNYVTIAQFKIYSPAGKFIINSAGLNYTISNGALTEISSEITPGVVESVGIASTGEFDTTVAEIVSPVKIVSYDELNIESVYYPHPQIIIPQTLTALSGYSKISAATLAATQAGNGEVRVAVTRDLKAWLIWNGSTWASIGDLPADTAGAEALTAQGMTPAMLNNITAVQWEALFRNSGGMPDYLAFALALDITDPVEDVAAMSKLALNVNEASSWKLQTPAEVEIRWRTDSVTFRTMAAGNYKLAYQTP